MCSHNQDEFIRNSLLYNVMKCENLKYFRFEWSTKVCILITTLVKLRTYLIFGNTEMLEIVPCALTNQLKFDILQIDLLSGFFSVLDQILSMRFHSVIY